jgi:hypothetical protein
MDGWEGVRYFYRIGRPFHSIAVFFNICLFALYWNYCSASSGGCCGGSQLTSFITKVLSSVYEQELPHY